MMRYPPGRLARRSAANIAPSLVAVGATNAANGSMSLALPTGHAANDILLMVLETSGDDAAPGTPSGWSVLNAAVQDTNTVLSTFWKRDNGSESAPSLSDAGDHQVG